MGLFNFFSKSEKTIPSISKYTIYDRYYSDYPEKPYISDDRNVRKWLEKADMFPAQSLVPKAMMVRYSDSLLPGHVYMLYWLNKYNNKKVPAYFEYEYGIDFEAEKDYLLKNGYINELNKLTSKGVQAIDAHISVIKRRHPSPQHSGNSGAGSPAMISVGRIIPTDLKQGNLTILPSDRILIDKEFEQLNVFIAFALKLARSKKKLSIDTYEFSYSHNYTFYEAQPYTPTGRPSKYPLVLHYAYATHNDLNPSQDYFGELYYTKSGDIGKARLIFWERKSGYMIHLALVDNQLVVKKVERNTPANWETIYKL